ncbi:MAG: hypothetical protein Q7S73_02605 [bacterium]|nr:hypothetical protein [bacterium]
MRRYFGTLAVLIFSGIGLYLVFNKENVSSYRFPNSLNLKGREIVSNLRGFTSSLASSTLAVTSGAKDKLISQISKKSEELFSRAVEGAKTQAFNLVKQEVNKNVDNLGQNFGISLGGSNSEVPSPITFAIKINQPAYFTVKNTESTAVEYEIDWQDNLKDSGQLSANTGKTLSHQWKNPGIYEPIFKIIKKDGQSEEHKVVISIF